MDTESSSEYMLSKKIKVQKSMLFVKKKKKKETHMNSCLYAVNVFEHGHKNLLAPVEGESFAGRTI